MPSIKNNERSYGAIAKLFHWVMAIMVIGMLAFGLYMTSLSISLAKLKYYGWHKETGILVLLLVTVRLLWRISNTIPTLPNHLAEWQKLAAHGAHYALYFLMIAMPLTGWLMSSAAGLPVSFFGLFTLPDIIGPNETTRQFLATTHEYLAYLLIFMIIAHASAALQHHFYYKDDILRRMLPW